MKYGFNIDIAYNKHKKMGRLTFTGKIFNFTS